MEPRKLIAAFWVPAAFGVGLFWAYGPTLADMANRWSRDPQYSHGYLVPVFAAVLLWFRREHFRPEAMRNNPWGLAIIVAGLALYLAGALYHFVFFDGVSLVISLFGVVLLWAGWAGIKWSWPSLLFLLFMIPMPYRLEHLLAGPLQAVATKASTFAMQTIGLPAFAEGNVIVLNEHRIGVVEACSGLSMLIIFLAISTAVVCVVRRPLLDKIVVLASAIPIAIVANVIRITVTGIMHEKVSSEAANFFFHDLAGWLMMPLALILLGVELWLLARLFSVPEKKKPLRLFAAAR